MAVELLPKILPNILFRTGGYGLGGLSGLSRYRAGDSPGPSLSFTGPANRTYVDAAGTVQTVGANVLRDAHFIGGVRGTLLETARINHFLNSGAPVTQTTPVLATGIYALWMDGTGSVTVSAGTATITGAGTASAGVTVIFNVTVTGTVTYTVAGSPTRVQAEAGSGRSSYIATAGAAVTRAVETFSTPYTAPPQALTVYAKFIELGTIAISGARVFEIASVASGNPRLLLFMLGGFYQAFHNNGTTTVTSTAAVAPAYGNTVELRVLLNADGSIQLCQSINGAAEVLAAASAANAFAAAWSGQNLYLNQSANAGSQGLASYQALKIAAGIRSLSDMRNF